MNNRLFVGITLTFLAISVIALLSAGWNDGVMTGWGMMGPWMMGGGWGFAPFGWIAMLVMWLIPVGFVVLIVLGLIWLVRSGYGTPNPGSGQVCPDCVKPIQANWANCPYCGRPLK